MCKFISTFICHKIKKHYLCGMNATMLLTLDNSGKPVFHSLNRSIANKAYDRKLATNTNAYEKTKISL